MMAASSRPPAAAAAPAAPAAPAESGPTDKAAAMRRLSSQCEFEFFRATGPGGQHRNTTESGVRVRHLPTGLMAQATERRSQARNREEALLRLAAKLAARARKRRARVKTVKSRGVRRRELDARRREAVRKSTRRRVVSED